MNFNIFKDLLQFSELKKVIMRLGISKQVMPYLYSIAVFFVLIIVKWLFFSSHTDRKIYISSKEPKFQNGRILSDRENSFYYNREKMISRTNQSIIESNQKLESKIFELEKKITENSFKQQSIPLAIDPKNNNAVTREIAQSPTSENELKFYNGPEAFAGQQVSQQQSSLQKILKRTSTPGHDLISFPVKSESENEGVILPSGSYVKAKIMTGVDVPEGKTYPVLMVLDYSYVAPNDHKIDLSGCFMIAKAEGDLSTERVQMQTTKMSCVSKHGKMFEREINGFIADNQDGSFAMKGEINSKQGRVAAVAFLASVVDGVGKAIQATQTTQSTNALGGSQSVLTGDSGKYIAAGGAANAANMVAQWYLQQAQSLAPTVSIGSGRDVWIVMKDKVNLPNDFFRKEGGRRDEGIYSYITRIVD